jgi:hypothetical protein
MKNFFFNFPHKSQQRNFSFFNSISTFPSLLANFKTVLSSQLRTKFRLFYSTTFGSRQRSKNPKILKQAFANFKSLIRFEKTVEILNDALNFSFPYLMSAFSISLPLLVIFLAFIDPSLSPKLVSLGIPQSLLVLTLGSILSTGFIFLLHHLIRITFSILNIAIPSNSLLPVPTVEEFSFSFGLEIIHAILFLISFDQFCKFPIFIFTLFLKTTTWSLDLSQFFDLLTHDFRVGYIIGIFLFASLRTISVLLIFNQGKDILFVRLFDNLFSLMYTIETENASKHALSTDPIFHLKLRKDIELLSRTFQVCFPEYNAIPQSLLRLSNELHFMDSQSLQCTYSLLERITLSLLEGTYGTLEKELSCNPSYLELPTDKV